MAWSTLCVPRLAGNEYIKSTTHGVEGRHPSWDELVEKVEAQGMVHEGQGAGRSRFWMDGGLAGVLRVTDVHEDNVVVNTKTNWAHLIDVHFALGNREARLKALRALGLW